MSGPGSSDNLKMKTLRRAPPRAYPTDSEEKKYMKKVKYSLRSSTYAQTHIVVDFKITSGLFCALRNADNGRGLLWHLLRSDAGKESERPTTLGPSEPAKVEPHGK